MTTRAAGDDLSDERRALFELMLKQRGVGGVKARTIPRRARQTPCAMSFAQERLWFLEQLGLVGTAYNMMHSLRVHGPMDITALERACGELIQRHESLRTRFAMLGSEPVQIVDPPGPFQLRHVDISDLPELDRVGRARQLAQEDAQRRFDLAAGPLLRVTLIRLAAVDHVLLLSMHHIISDGWSMAVLMRELRALYAAHISAHPANLPPLPVQYGDYAVWQRQWLRGAALEQQMQYWRERLSHAPPALELPTDRPRPAVASFKGDVLSFGLPLALSTALGKLARSSGATLFMILLAAYQVLLSRYSGQQDIVVGSPIAGRTQRQAEELIGFFVNMLVLRTDLRGDPSFRELLGQVKETTLGAYAHQDLPFEKLVAELQPERDLSRQPLFQAVLGLQNVPQEDFDLSGLTPQPFPGEEVTAKFDLALLILERPVGVVGSFEYATELFDRQTIARMASHLRVLLEGVVECPDARISELALMTPAERQDVLRNPVGEMTPDSHSVCIHQRFSEAALRRPEATAVVCEGRQLTYAQLDARSNQLAHHLIAHGVRPEVIVGLCIERSIEMVIGILAILKAGGAYLPLDPTYPRQRLQFMVEDAGVSLILTQQGAAERLPPACTLLKLDVEWDRFPRWPASGPAVAACADHLAYCIYTSGSTGRPKGALLTHRNVMRLLAATGRWFGFSHQDVWTLFHSYAFDFSVWELFGCLLHGGRLVVVPYLVSRSPEACYDLLCHEQVTVFNQTPLAFTQLLSVARERADAGKLEHLRLVIFGGDALSVGKLEPWYALYDRSMPRLVNMYGITETTVHVTYCPLGESPACTRGISPIGVPIPDLCVYILDRHLSPAPVGIPGEIYVSGPGLARGYLGRAGLTAERFVADPFSERPGARMYRTGDRGQRLPDGSLSFMGRMDQQLKLRGHRIEPREIEDCLRRHPAVGEAVVLTTGADEGNRRLVAWVVPGTEVSAAHLQSYLREQLPPFMVPADVVLLERLPLTSNGKVDHSRLPAPQPADRRTPAQPAPPRTALEALLAEIWEDVLEVYPVGMNDNFFALGGDSIRSLQIVRLARSRGVAISVADVFTHQTIAQLARAAHDPGARTRRRSELPLHRLTLSQHLTPELVDVYPLTAMQTIMVREYLHNARRETGIYHVQQSFRIEEPSPSVHAMQAALERLIALHPVLRTALVVTGDGTLLQGIRSSLGLQIEQHDLTGLPGVEQDRHIEERLRLDRATPFEIGTPLLRVYWFHLAEQSFEMLMSIHHAIDDGWGNQHFLSQLFDLYQRIKNGEHPPVAYGVNVHKEQVALEHEIRDSAEAQQFWDGLPLCVTDGAYLERRGSQRDSGHRQETEKTQDIGRQERHTLFLDEGLIPQLRALSRRMHASLKAIFLSAYVDVIRRELSIPRPTVGVVMNGRSDRLSDPLNSLGLFWNLLPCCPPSGHDGADPQMLVIQGLLSRAEPYTAYPLTQIERSRGCDSLFFATYNFVNFHNSARLNGHGGLRLRRATGHDRFHYPLNYSVAVDRDPDSVYIHAEYDGRHFTAHDVQKMSAGLADILECYVGGRNEAAATA